VVYPSSNVNRRTLLLSPLALALPAIDARAQEPASIERQYWPTNGWRTDDPANQKVDPAMLDQVDRIIETAMPDVTGLIVIRGGYIVHERYFGGRYGRDDPVRIWSITKSVTGSLIGRALADGLLTGLDQTIGELLPNRIPDDADPRTPAITIRQLLTMTSGWQWDIATDYDRLIASNDWLAYTLSQPVVHEPGTFFAYNSGGSHALSVIVEAASGEDTADYAQETIFTPLGIARPAWERSPQGEAAGGFGLALTPRDLAKLGFLALNRGQWDGQSLIPESYLAEATSRQADGDATGDAAYGYQWWVTELQGMRAYFALGFANQYLYVVPDRDLAVVVAKGFADNPPLITAARPLIERFIVPAAQPRTPVG
jgi:CubicO group peptidase (beta-lactamase class C family)